MSGILEFLEGKKKILFLNDLKDFFKDSFLSTQKDVLTRGTASNNNLYEYVLNPIYDLDGRMVEYGYVLKKANSYSSYQSDFIFIVDEVKKIIILNEYSFLNVMYPYLEPTQEKALIRDYIYNSDDLSDEEIKNFKDFKYDCIKENIGSYKVLSATILKNEFNNNLYSFIEVNLQDYAKKTDIENRYEEVIVMKSKDFFTGVSSFDRELSSGRYTPNYLKIIKAYQNRCDDDASYIYNYALDKSSVLAKYKDFIDNIMLNDSDDGLKYSLNLKNMYILESSKEYLDENMSIYENDEALTRMRDILSSVKESMRTILINGEKVKNEIVLDYRENTIRMPDVKYKNISHAYSIYRDIELKYGNKVLYKVDKIDD